MVEPSCSTPLTPASRSTPAIGDDGAGPTGPMTDGAPVVPIETPPDVVANEMAAHVKSRLPVKPGAGVAMSVAFTQMECEPGDRPARLIVNGPRAEVLERG